jgi:hypothetical protein
MKLKSWFHIALYTTKDSVSYTTKDSVSYTTKDSVSYTTNILPYIYLCRTMYLVFALASCTIAHHAKYHLTLFMSPCIISCPLLCHQTLKNKYAKLEITFVLSLAPLFISPECNVNVTIEGSYNTQKFLIFAAHFTNSLPVDATSLFLFTVKHHRHKMWQLLEVHFLSL